MSEQFTDDQIEEIAATVQAHTDCTRAVANHIAAPLLERIATLQRELAEAQQDSERWQLAKSLLKPHSWSRGHGGQDYGSVWQIDVLSLPSTRNRVVETANTVATIIEPLRTIEEILDATLALYQREENQMAEQNKCEHCDGTGSVSAPYPPPARGFRILECVMCGGTGIQCEHRWVGGLVSSSPSEPDEWTEYCDECGMERNEDD